MKFNSYSSLPQTIPSPAGEEIYIWEYIADDGEIIEQRRDVYAEIQSYENTTRYKELIENGLDFSDDSRGVYADVSELAGDGDYIGTASAYISELIKELTKVTAFEQSKASAKPNVESAETAEKDTKTTKEGDK